MATRARGSRTDSPNGIQPRRQANACLRCYEKKVKCDMDSMGHPCTGCATLGIECQKRSRKPYPPRKDTRDVNGGRTRSETPTNSTSKVDRAPSPPSSVPSEPLPTPSFDAHPGYFDMSSSLPESHTTFDDFTVPGHSTAGLLPPVSATGEDTAMTGTVPFFSGDEQGYGFILDICNAERKDSIPPQHFLVPQLHDATLDHEAITYAESKGCFTIPSQAICDDLIQCYFHYVHPMLPILDCAEFLGQYTEGNTNVLLLWSMFSVAANFVSDATLSLSGFKTRQDLKKLTYSRAKCLFDISYEQDRITLIQSALLLGFWYADLQDNAQSWHWTGIAISTAQTIGLHRDPDSKHFNSAISASRRQRWANIWWCCFFRDRWLSFGYGRPLRIDADDCDVPMPTIDCMLDLPEHCPTAWRRYVPADLPHFAPLWLGLVNLTVVLGEVLTANYQPRKPSLDATTLDSLERRIEGCLPDKQVRPAYPELLLFFESYARLHVEAAMIALYRPYASEFLATRAIALDPAMGAMANIKIRAAATRASGVLDRIISTDTLRFAGPMMVPLLVPAMTIHLLQARSHDHFTSSWSKNRLELSLLVLRRLEANYPAASLVYELFAQAKDNNAIPFGITSQVSSSLQRCDSVVSHATSAPATTHWQGINNCALDLRPSLGTPGLNHWPSPDLHAGLWNLTPTLTPPPQDNLFFPLDNL